MGKNKLSLPALIVGVYLTVGFPQYKNYRVSSFESDTPEEVTIAINPVNPGNLAAGANLDFYYYSFDGGISWNQGRLTSPFGVWGDPCVIFDADGNLFFAHLSNPGENGYWIDRIVVQKSTDGGVSWDDGIGIGYSFPKNQDKEWMAVDHTNSPHRNNIYMAWTEFDEYGSLSSEDSSRILFSRSTNSGESWNKPVRISDRGGNCLDKDQTVEGAVPAVGPDGEVYLSWSGPEGILFDKSLDGGRTFGKDIFVDEQPGGWDFNVPGIFRSNGFPVTACDISLSAYRGRIYILWSDQRNGWHNTDIFVSKSDNKGETWSSPVMVNNDNEERHQFFPWLSVDPVTGVLYVVFYDRRATEGNETEVWMARSDDGGETFTNFKVGERKFTPLDYVFFGDYINIAALNGRVHPIWTEMNGTSLSVWTAVIDENTGIDPETIQPETFTLFQNYPNPFNQSTMIRYQIGEIGANAKADVRVHHNRPQQVTLFIYTHLGQKITVLESGIKAAGYYLARWNAEGFPSGIYYYELTVGNKKQRRKMILLR